MNERDADLCDMCALQRGGDDRALDRLMARHKDALFGFICGFVSDREDACELLADTFVRVYLKRDSFTRPGRFKSWLYTIAANLCKDHCRGRSWKQRMAARMPGLFENVRNLIAEVPDPRPDPAGIAVGREALSELQAAVDSLPLILKTALILHVIEQRSQAECAERLGVSVKTVETRVYRARRLLSAKLDRAESASTHSATLARISMSAG